MFAKPLTIFMANEYVGLDNLNNPRNMFAVSVNARRCDIKNAGRSWEWTPL